MHLLIWIHAKGMLLILSPFVNIKYEGISFKDFKAPAILVFNHQSFIDAYLLGFLPVFDSHLCLKGWPFKMYWYRVYMRLAQYIDLENSPWSEVISQAKKATDQQSFLVFYPEGTRARTEEMSRFYSGAFFLGIELDIPIIPVCICGTKKLLSRGSFLFNPTPIQIKSLPPINSSDYSGPIGHVAFRKDVKAMMVKTVKEMEASLLI